MDLKVNINWQEVYQLLCPSCQAKLKNYVKTKIAEQLADDLLGTKNESGGE